MYHRNTASLFRKEHIEQKYRCRNTVFYLVALGTLCGALMVSGCGDDDDDASPPSEVTVPPTSSTPSRLVTPSRSTSIALTSDDRFAILANRETNTVAVIEVRDAQGQDVGNKITEIAVGQEPRYVAVSPDNREVYVSNTVSGTVSVISLPGRLGGW